MAVNKPGGWLIWFVLFIWFIGLVFFNQKKPNELNEPNNVFRILLVPHLEDQIEAKTEEKNVRHPAGDQRCQSSATAECNRDGMCRPIAEADGNCLPDSYRHAPTSCATPAETQRNTD